MKQFVFLGDTTWRVSTSAEQLEWGRYLGEQRDIPRGAREPGDWFVLLVRRGPLDRRWTLVAVDSIAAAAPRSGARAHRSRSRDGKGAGPRPVYGRGNGSDNRLGAAPAGLVGLTAEGRPARTAGLRMPALGQISRVG
jgi:hypothetical protein